MSIAPGITPNETGPVAGTFNLTRTGNLTKSLTVNYTLAGTATVNTDYTDSSSGTVTFATNSATATVTLPVTDDSAIDPNETIIATITANAASTDPNYNGIAVAAVTANIADNDTAPIGNIECNCPPMPEPPQIPDNSPTRPNQNGEIEGTNNNDVLIGSNRPNLIFALGGNDTVIGQSGRILSTVKIPH